MAIERVVSGSPSEESGVVLRTVGLISVERMTNETVVSGSPGEAVRVGTAELASAPWLVATECVMSDAPLEKTGVVLGTVELVSSE